MADELDYGPHRECAVCGKRHPEKRMIEYNKRWYCSLRHKLKQEDKDNDPLYERLLGRNVVRFNKRTR